MNALGKYCEACQAVPTNGFCALAGCPLSPAAGESCLDRIRLAAIALSISIEQKIPALAAQLRSDEATLTADGSQERMAMIVAALLCAQRAPDDDWKAWVQTALDFATNDRAALAEGAAYADDQALVAGGAQ